MDAHFVANSTTALMQVAGIAQFQLVHIHPFVDGNGRTSRLLSTLCLYRSGYDFKRLLTISELYDRTCGAGVGARITFAMRGNDPRRVPLDPAVSEGSDRRGERSACRLTTVKVTRSMNRSESSVTHSAGISMDQLSLRGFDKELARRIKELARREHVSLNKAALLLMRRGAGLVDAPSPSATVGDALDQFIGRWSATDEKRLLESIAPFEAVDEALWK